MGLVGRWFAVDRMSGYAWHGHKGQVKMADKGNWKSTEVRGGRDDEMGVYRMSGDERRWRNDGKCAGEGVGGVPRLEFEHRFEDDMIETGI